MTIGQFEFEVERTRAYPDGFDKPAVYEGYRVYLPHSCDEWDIVGGWSSGASRSAAIEKLRQFIDEAELALRELEQMPDLVGQEVGA